MKCCRNVEAGVFNEHCSFILEMMLQGGHCYWLLVYNLEYYWLLYYIDRNEHKGSGSQTYCKFVWPVFNNFCQFYHLFICLNGLND